jgi:hypothetical protein
MHAILWKEFKEAFYNLLRMISTFITPVFLLIVPIGEWEKNPRLQAKTLVRALA